MPRQSNDIALVRRPEYKKLPTGMKREPPPDPDPVMTEWQPLQIKPDREHSHGHSQLPPGVDDTNGIELFQLFFTDALLNELACYSNCSDEEYYRESGKTTAEFARAWKPTCRQELYVYLGVLLYMALQHEPSISDYWKTSDGFLPDHPLRNYISRNRFEPMDHFLYCTQPGQSFQSPFGRIIDLSDYIKLHVQKCYKAGPNVAVDEMIQRFQEESYRDSQYSS